MNKVIFSFFLATLIKSQGSNFPDFVNIDYGGKKESLFMDIYLPDGNKIPIQW